MLDILSISSIIENKDQANRDLTQANESIHSLRFQWD